MFGQAQGRNQCTPRQAKVYFRAELYGCAAADAYLAMIQGHSILGYIAGSKALQTCLTARDGRRVRTITEHILEEKALGSHI